LESGHYFQSAYYNAEIVSIDGQLHPKTDGYSSFLDAFFLKKGQFGAQALRVHAGSEKGSHSNWCNVGSLQLIGIKLERLMAEMTL